MQQINAFIEHFLPGTASTGLLHLRMWKGPQARLFMSLAFLVVFCAAVASPIRAAGNHLDYDFSVDGKLTTNFGNPLTNENPEDWGHDAAYQADGKLVVVGTTTAGRDFDFALVRYLEDGTLDTTFGSNGKVMYEIDGWQFASSVAIQTDGKIVVAGYYDSGGTGNYQFLVTRYYPNGTIEQTKIINATNGSDIASSVAVQPDGKIVIAGYSTVNSANWNWTLVRLHSNFTYDMGFGNSSVVTTDFAGGIDTAREVVVQGNRLLVGGTCWSSARARQDFALVRYNLDDGSIDIFFAGTGYGKAIANFSGSSEDRVRSMSCVNSRCILVGETSLSGGRIAIASFKSSGELNTGFDGDGKVTADLSPGNTESAMGALFLLTGDLYIAARVESPAWNASFTLLRYDMNGRIDPTFGTGGRTNTIFGAGAAVPEVVLSGPSHTYSRITVVGSAQMGSASNFAVARHTQSGIAVPSDFDDDGRADFGLFRPSDGTWYISNSATGAFSTIAWGTNGDIPVPGEYIDRTGMTDAAVVRPSNSTWYVLRSSSQYSFTQPLLGQSGDIPVQGDYNGDGKTETAVFRPSNSTWYMKTGTNPTITVPFGQAGDKPAQADYDGDGLTDVAVFRPSNGTWYIQRSLLGYTTVQFGMSGDRPMPADFDGDARMDICVYRPSNSTFYFINSQNNTVSTVQLGTVGDIPAPADFDGDGHADVTVFRPTDGTWYSLPSTTGTLFSLQFGQSGDIPVSSAYTPQ